MSRTVVITGAGAGLGRTLSRQMAAQGDRVVLLGRTLSKLEDVVREIDAGALALNCDVSSAQSVEDAFAQIGEIDVLVNNAATYEPFFVADASDTQLRAAIDTNFLGPIHTSRAAISRMNPGGHIINISSESVGMNFPMLSLYQSSKAGMERFSEALGKELAGQGIRVTVLRAGVMYDEDSTAPKDWDRDAAVRFHGLCLKAGLDLRERPATHFRSVAKVIAQLIEMPKDLSIPMLQVEGFRIGV